MKPFNLEAALAGAPVVTVIGSPVTGLHRFDGVSDGLCLVGVYGGGIETWHENGRFNTDRRMQSEMDLRMAEGDES